MLKRSLSIITAAAVMSALAPASSLAAEGMARSTQFWRPDTLSLEPLRAHDLQSNPYGNDFDYAKAFSTVDLKALNGLALI